MSKKSENARADIIKAARKVLSQIGVANMTLQAVADAASISKGALYYYYKSKDEILYHIMEQDMIHSRLLAIRAIEPESEYSNNELKKDVIKGMIDRFYRLEKNKINLYLQGEALQGNPELRKKYNEKYEEWIGNFSKILSRLYGVDPDPLIRTFSTFLVGAVEGICLQYALMDKVEADEEFMGRLLMFLFSIDYEKVVNYIRNNPRFDFN